MFQIFIYLLSLLIKEKLMEYLNNKNIKCAIHYPNPFYESEGIIEKKVDNCPIMDIYKYKYYLYLCIYENIHEKKSSQYVTKSINLINCYNIDSTYSFSLIAISSSSKFEKTHSFGISTGFKKFCFPSNISINFLSCIL